MLSVVIPTEGVEQSAVATLSSLVPGAAAGVITEVLLIDRAADTSTIERVADVAGCGFLRFEGSHAAALAEGAARARAPWLMFLPAGAVLDRLRSIARSLAGPLGDQGLLIARDHYRQIGGYKPNARRAETKLLRQLGRSSRTMLRSRIVMI
jgi:hypothetical protein